MIPWMEYARHEYIMILPGQVSLEVKKKLNVFSRNLAHCN